MYDFISDSVHWQMKVERTWENNDFNSNLNINLGTANAGGQI